MGQISPKEYYAEGNWLAKPSKITWHQLLVFFFSMPQGNINLLHSQISLGYTLFTFPGKHGVYRAIGNKLKALEQFSQWKFLCSRDGRATVRTMAPFRLMLRCNSTPLLAGSCEKGFCEEYILLQCATLLPLDVYILWKLWICWPSGLCLANCNQYSSTNSVATVFSLKVTAQDSAKSTAGALKPLLLRNDSSSSSCQTLALTWRNVGSCLGYKPRF